MNIKSLEKYSLSAKDIVNLVGSYVPIVRYPDLADYNLNHFLKLFDNPKRGFVLFFETESMESGHWQCLFMDLDKQIHFFDSYGLKPDEAKDYLRKNTLIKLNESKPYLTKLLDKCIDLGYPVSYSPHQYQKMVGNVDTCGRWVSVRLYNSMKSDSQFVKYIESLKKRYNVGSDDEAVCELTFEFIHK